MLLTGSKDLGEDALLVGAVNVVRGLALLVGPVEKAAIFWVAQQKLSQLPASSPDCYVECSVSFLSLRENTVSISPNNP